MNAQLWKLAARQLDLVARWQLVRLGWSHNRIDHARAKGRWRSVHRGVYALSSAPLTRPQRWLAASLTAPNTFLSNWSAGGCHGFREHRAGFETVTRPGTGGPKSAGRLVVFRSTTLAGHTTIKDGIPITTAERTLIDLAPRLDEKALRRALREALRLKTTTTERIAAAVTDLDTPRGSALLAELAARYAHVPYRRTRSDAEALALEQIHDRGAELPRVNVRIGGKEADLVFPDSKEIVEIDGPQFHQFPDEDAAKEAAWRDAGYRVRRVSSDDVYDASYPPSP